MECFYFIIGNKADVDDDMREVTPEEGQEWVDSYMEELDEDDLRDTLAALLPVPIEQVNVGAILQKADTDNDGRISYEVCPRPGLPPDLPKPPASSTGTSAASLPPH